VGEISERGQEATLQPAGAALHFQRKFSYGQRLVFNRFYVFRMGRFFFVGRMVLQQAEGSGLAGGIDLADDVFRARMERFPLQKRGVVAANQGKG